jgi:cytochrome b561
VSNAIKPVGSWSALQPRGYNKIECYTNEAAMSAVSSVHLTTHYSAAQRLLHWAMALIIFSAIGLGIYASYFQVGTPLRRELLFIHKSLGMTALVLVALRILYRAMVGAPDYTPALSKINASAAHLAHMLLYALMLLMPFSGYVFSVAGNHDVPWFGLFEWPLILPHDELLSEAGELVHQWGAYVLDVLLAGHIAAVIWHQWVKKDSVLARMV